MAQDKFSQAVNNFLMGCRRNRRWKLTLVFMLCASSCFRATTEEEQAQSKKGLKKQQKEAEKAAKKAEKQAKLVSMCVVCFFFFLPPPIHPTPPLPAVKAECTAVWALSPGGPPSHRRGKSIHCLSIPVILTLFMSCQTEYKALFSSTLAARHDLLVCELHVRWDIKHLKSHLHDNVLEIHHFFLV